MPYSMPYIQSTYELPEFFGAKLVIMKSRDPAPLPLAVYQLPQ